MFIPGIINLMLDICRACSGRERLSRRELVAECTMVPPLYPLWVITESINTAVGTLRGTVDEADIEVTKEIKLIEIIGE